jgi:hypothetical protein
MIEARRTARQVRGSAHFLQPQSISRYFPNQTASKAAKLYTSFEFKVWTQSGYIQKSIQIYL